MNMQVKEKVQRRLGHPVHSQRLVFETTALNDTQTLQDAQASNDAVIGLCLRTDQGDFEELNIQPFEDDDGNLPNGDPSSSGE